jgi:hypothetical protein
MADHYMLTSFLYPLDEDREGEARISINQTLHSIAEERDEDPGDFELMGSISFEPDGIWFSHHNNESADVDAFAEVVAGLQLDLKAKEPFVFSYAYTCSKPRLSEFGGGAIACLPDGRIKSTDALVALNDVLLEEE